MHSIFRNSVVFRLCRKITETSTSFVMPVCPSVHLSMCLLVRMKKLGLKWIFMNFYIGRVFIINVEKNASFINPLSDELNPICHLLALLGGATIVVVSRLMVKIWQE